MIVLDTSFLSLVFRRPRGEEEAATAATLFRELVTDELPLGVPAVVVQEILSGIRSEKQFDDLQSNLDGLQVLVAEMQQHLLAARIMNQCLAAGITPSSIDVLIAAQTISTGGSLLTYDRDFEKIAPHCGLQLYVAD